MKKICSLALIVFLMLTLAVSAFADDPFVPSISDKGAPQPVEDEDEVIGTLVDDEGQELHEVETDCIVITPLSEADSSEEIPDGEREELKGAAKDIEKNGLSVFPGLGSSDLAVRDLFNITALCNELQEDLPREGTSVDLTFDLGLDADVDFLAMVLGENGWERAQARNNGDGTVTVTFEDFGTVAFLSGIETGHVPVTGGTDSAVTLWVSLMATSAALLVALLFVYSKKEARDEQ